MGRGIQLAAIGLLAASLVVAQSPQSPVHIPTYIEAVFPPDGALEFSESFYWQPYYVLVAIFCIFLGAPIAFFGYRLHRVCKVGAGFALSYAVTFLSLQSLGYTPWWINGFVATVAGGIGGWVTYTIAALGLYLLGFLSGFLLSALLWSGFIGQAWGDELWFQITSWVLCLAVAAAAGVPGLFLQRWGLLVNTSLLGSYLMVIGLDYYTHDGLVAVVGNMFFFRATEFFPIWMALLVFFGWLFLAGVALVAQVKVTALHFDHRRSGTKRAAANQPDVDFMAINI